MKNLNEKFCKLEDYKDEITGKDCWMWHQVGKIHGSQKIPILKMFSGEWENAWHYDEHPIINTVKLFKKIK